MASKSQPLRVAVIGLGLAGVGSLKNLREVGLDAVGFERNDYLGGLWRWTDDPKQTSVLRTTVANISSERNSYTDFPFPKGTPSYPTAEQMIDYIDSYADHFQLRPYCRLGCMVERIARSTDGQGWIIESKGKGVASTQDERFDKVLITTGTYSKPFTPEWEGMKNFQGQIVHSQAFKDPSEFAKKRVIVVGMSNTGCDTAVELSKAASKVYLSHRNGGRVLSRFTKKKRPADHQGTRRIVGISISLMRSMPHIAGKLGAFGLERQMKSNPAYSKEWGLLPAGPLPWASPIANDHIFDMLADGSITSVMGVKCFHSDGTTVELLDGTILYNIDAVVCATGYRYDYSILADKEADPTSHPAPEWKRAAHSNHMDYPRLYQGIFSAAFPDSLAFLGAYRGPSPAAFTGFDLMSQAIAQVFCAGYRLLPQAEIDRWCDAQYRYLVSQVEVWRIHKVMLPPGNLEMWLNEVVENGMNENLGWGWQAWKFWLSDRKLYSAIMDGVDTAYVYRLFDGKRPKWDGAREAILQMSSKG